MYIFPAWVKHWVYPFKSDCTRISISGNVIDRIELSKLKKANGKEKDLNGMEGLESQTMYIENDMRKFLVNERMKN